MAHFQQCLGAHRNESWQTADSVMAHIQPVQLDEAMAQIQLVQLDDMEVQYHMALLNAAFSFRSCANIHTMSFNNIRIF